jgi:hypothetical protein
MHLVALMAAWTDNLLAVSMVDCSVAGWVVSSASMSAAKMAGKSTNVKGARSAASWAWKTAVHSAECLAALRAGRKADLTAAQTADPLGERKVGWRVAYSVAPMAESLAVQSEKRTAGMLDQRTADQRVYCSVALWVATTDG